MQKTANQEQKPKNASTSDTIIRFVLNNKALLILIVLVIVALILCGSMFSSWNNISSVIRQIITIALLGIGFTVVLASGGVDLSVGHMLSFIGVAYAIVGKETSSLFVAVLVALVLGVVCGLFNGIVSQKLRLAPFIVTLASAQIFRGLASLASGGQVVSGTADQPFPDGLKEIGQGTIFGGAVPISAIITLALAGIIAIVLYRTRYGRHLIATGGNQEAASVSGINISFIKISAYVVMGVFVAVGAIILTGRVNMAQPTAGAGLEMDAIAAVVIGGTPMSGGKARVGGTIFGCMIMGVMANLLNLMGVSSFWQWVVKGIIIIAAIIMDAQTERFFNERLRKAK